MIIASQKVEPISMTQKAIVWRAGISTQPAPSFEASLATQLSNQTLASQTEQSSEFSTASKSDNPDSKKHIATDSKTPISLSASAVLTSLQKTDQPKLKKEAVVKKQSYIFLEKTSINAKSKTSSAYCLTDRSTPTPIHKANHPRDSLITTATGKYLSINFTKTNSASNRSDDPISSMDMSPETRKTHTENFHFEPDEATRSPISINFSCNTISKHKDSSTESLLFTNKNQIAQMPVEEPATSNRGSSILDTDAIKQSWRGTQSADHSAKLASSREGIEAEASNQQDKTTVNKVYKSSPKLLAIGESSQIGDGQKPIGKQEVGEDNTDPVIVGTLISKSSSLLTFALSSATQNGKTIPEDEKTKAGPASPRDLAANASDVRASTQLSSQSTSSISNAVLSNGSQVSQDVKYPEKNVSIKANLSLSALDESKNYREKTAAQAIWTASSTTIFTQPRSLTAIAGTSVSSLGSPINLIQNGATEWEDNGNSVAHPVTDRTSLCLESRVSGGLDGCFKVRAEMDSSVVNAVLSSTSKTGLSMLHEQLNAINSYLQKENIPVAVHIAEKIDASHTLEYSQNQQSLNASFAQQHRRDRQEEQYTNHSSLIRDKKEITNLDSVSLDYRMQHKPDMVVGHHSFSALA